MAKIQTFYNVSSRAVFEEQLAAGNIPARSIAFIKDKREIWAQGVFYPCDFSAGVLPSAPAGSTLSYTDGLGYEREFRIGQACVYASAELPDGYGIAFLKAVVDGSAVWQDLGDVLAKASESLALSEEANDYSRAAYANSTEALNQANTAIESIASLKGFSEADDVMVELAKEITKIEQNRTDVAVLKELHVVLSESEYDALDIKDQTKIYMTHEDE